MKLLLSASCASLLALTPAPLLAQDAPAAPTAAEPAAIDPVRLEAARAVVAKVFPEGAYSRMMEEAMGGATQTILDSVGKMPLRDLAGIGGLSAEKVQQMGPGTLAEIMAIYDPAYKDRMARMMQVMGSEMASLFTKFEPDMRAGLQRAYARRFTTEQLVELNRFFKSETGATYADQALMIWVDPDVVKGMQAAMPEMLKAMPAMMEKVTAATADLPKARKLEDLSKAERARLAQLLGIPKAELGKKR